MNVKKIISLIITASVLLTCMSIPALASAKTLVLLGDSIAAGTGLMDAKTESYGAITAKANGWNYENYAVAGHTSFNLEQRLQNDGVRDAVSRADIICVSIGGNNYIQSGIAQIITDAAAGDFTKLDDITADFYESFCRIRTEIRALNPDAVFIVQKLYNPRNDALKSTYQQGTDRLNAAFERILSENPDTFTLLEVPSVINGHASYINADTIHPNKYGHYAIACLLTETLYNMGAGTASQPDADSDPGSLSFFEKIIRFFTLLFAKIRDLFIK